MATMFATCNIIVVVTLLLTCVSCKPTTAPYCDAVSVGEETDVLVKKVFHSHIANDTINIKETAECPGGISAVKVFGCYREYFNLTVSTDLLFVNVNRNSNDSDLPVDIFLQLNAYCTPESKQEEHNVTTSEYETTTENAFQKEVFSIRQVMAEAQTGVERAQEEVERAVKKLMKVEKSEEKVQKRIDQTNLAIQSAEKSVVVAQKGVYDAQNFFAKVNEKYSYATY